MSKPCSSITLIMLHRFDESSPRSMLVAVSWLQPTSSARDVKKVHLQKRKINMMTTEIFLEKTNRESMKVVKGVYRSIRKVFGLNSRINHPGSKERTTRLYSLTRSFRSELCPSKWSLKNLPRKLLEETIDYVSPRLHLVLNCTSSPTPSGTDLLLVEKAQRKSSSLLERDVTTNINLLGVKTVSGVSGKTPRVGPLPVEHVNREQCGELSGEKCTCKSIKDCMTPERSARKKARLERQFRLDFWIAINRGLTSYFKYAVDCPKEPWVLEEGVDVVKVAKFIFNAPLSLALDTPLPPGGTMDDLQKFLPLPAIVQIEKKNVEFGMVMTQLKRCMPLLTKERVLEAKKAHQKKVTNAPNFAPSQRHISLVKQACRNMFRTRREWTVKDSDFSESASYDVFKLSGGGRSKLRCDDGCAQCIEVDRDDDEPQLAGRYHDRTKEWNDFLTKDIRKARVCAVNSNMKARIVTAHESPCNFFRNLQQLLHSTMKKKSVFSLTGKMPEDSDFPCFRPRDGLVFCSADYSSATDGIHGDVSRAALDAIFSVIPPPTDLDPQEYLIFKEQASRTLTSAQLSYGPFKPLIDQVLGQMMGHLLSFPILCAINFAIWGETMLDSGEIDEDEFDSLSKGYTDTALRINGDDLLSQMTKESYDIFVKIVAKNGWELSVGKSYLHQRFGVINSQIYDFAEQKQIAEAYKFGGLQKGADSEAFAHWLTRKSEECIPDFFEFFFGWIRSNYGHPVTARYTRFLPPHIQDRIHSLFGQPTHKDMFTYWRQQWKDSRVLLEEMDVLALFKRQHPELVSEREAAQIELWSIKRSEFKKSEKLYGGFSVGSSNPHLDKMAGIVYLMKDLLRDIDSEYWAFLGKWRSTRLAIEDYGRSEKEDGGRFMRYRMKPKKERSRIYASFLERFRFYPDIGWLGSQWRQFSPHRRSRFFVHPEREAADSAVFKIFRKMKEEQFVPALVDDNGRKVLSRDRDFAAFKGQDFFSNFSHERTEGSLCRCNSCGVPTDESSNNCRMLHASIPLLVYGQKNQKTLLLFHLGN